MANPSRLAVSVAALVAGLLLRLAYIQRADIWIDEAATLQHVLHWDLDTMIRYNVNSGYYLLLQALSGKDAGLLAFLAQGLSLLGLPLGWWMLGRQLEEEGHNPFWPRLFLVVWPPLFVFDCIMRPYALGVGLLFTAWHLMNTARLPSAWRLAALGLVTVLGVYTLYLNAVYFAVLALVSAPKNRRSNLLMLVAVPLICFPATRYVLEQNILNKPLIGSTGEPDSWWRALPDSWIFFRFPKWPGLVLGGVLALAAILGMRGSPRLRGFLLATGLMAALLWATHTSSFDRLYLGALVFIIPSLEVGARRLMGRRGPPIILLLLLLALPWVLQRSVKINGARTVAAILEREWRPGDVVAVHSGFQSLPLYWLSTEPMRSSIITPHHPITTPEFYGLPKTSTLPDESAWVQRALQAQRLWVWGGTTELDDLLMGWPAQGQWAVESGGNGSRLLELRRRP